MNNKDNSKVPIAILSCFLIAFTLQGILKISGVFIFEKALEWDIFKIIDNSKYLTMCYYSSIIMLIQYCLSFSFVGNITNKKWYHYVLILLSSTMAIIVRTNPNLTQSLNTFVDIVLYVIIPVIINLTSHKDNRLFKRDVSDFILTTSMQISLYFCYLGLTYWSSMLNSIIVINPTWVSSSRAFLIYFEIYLGLITFMLGMNMLINKIKRREYMIMPVNIASDEAKEKELEEVKEKDTKKNNG